MSLYKQLWISIFFLMMISFIGSFIFSCLSAKAYLEEQLFRKNIDNASTIALSLSSGAHDNLTMELFINSQFDTGHYQFISLVDTKGNVIAAQFDDSQFKEAPNWLTSLFKINVKPGVAKVSNGWQRVGTLTLSSHVRFAYQQLWDNAIQLFYYFALMSLTCGVIGSVILRRLTGPLRTAVTLAEAIGDRRFMTSNEPKTLEFRAVIRSLNKLSKHVKEMLDDESSKLEKLRKSVQKDQITGLYNRDPLLAKLQAYLQANDESAHGALVLIRISDLFNLNQEKGRVVVDKLLQAFGHALDAKCQASTGARAIAGRLNGSDFLCIFPEAESQTRVLGSEIHEKLVDICRELELADISLLSSCSAYSSEENIGHVLRRLDSGLEEAGAQQNQHCFFVDSQSTATDQNWDHDLSLALEDKRFKLIFSPVFSKDETLFHWESSIHLITEDGSTVHAATFMPHLSRLGLSGQLDNLAVSLALDTIKDKPRTLAIRISASTLAHPAIMGEISEQLQEHAQLTQYIHFEIPEHGVFKHIDGLKSFHQLLAHLDCKIGVKHAGHEIKHIGQIHDLGLHYVKIDREFIRDIHQTTEYQIYLRGICTIVHSIGLKAIAEGVHEESEWKSLYELGFDGGTGSYFSERNDEG